MSETLFEKYARYHPEIINILNAFQEQHKNRFYRKLKEEKNTSNFFSTISELKFGKLFNTLNFHIEYEKDFPNKQTPDWTITIEDSIVICDVYRLGKSKIDQIRSDFENELIEKIKTIEENYCIKITFIEEYFESKKYNIDSIIRLFTLWLKSSKKNKGERILIENNFEFEVLQNNTIYSHLTCVGNASSIDIKPYKMKQNLELKPNELTKKLFKYNELIKTYKAPYFICVDIDFVSGFEHEDFEAYYRGNRIVFIDHGYSLGNLKQFEHLGKEWTELGVFYSNLQLSGIITLYNGIFKLLLNPMRSQLIYQDTYKIFLNELSLITN